VIVAGAVMRGFLSEKSNVGWAKARLRAVPTTSESVEDMVGTLRFAHPTN
jgi:hypothetical protein